MSEQQVYDIFNQLKTMKVIQRNSDNSITCPACSSPIELRIYDWSDNPEVLNDVGVCSECGLDVIVQTVRIKPVKEGKPK